MFNAHEHTSGCYISGGTKMTVALQLLAGRDSYDLGVIFDITSKHYEMIFMKCYNNGYLKHAFEKSKT